MSSRVVLRLFSGRLDPQWTIEKDQADKILGRLSDLPLQARLFRPEVSRGKPADVLGRPRSGYRGFEIFQDPESRAPAFRIFGELVFDAAAERIRSDGTDQWEEAVWQSAPPEIIKGLDNITLKELRTPDHEALIQGVQGEFVSVECPTGPQWIARNNPFDRHMDENNCYNYATTKLNERPRTDPALPGRRNQRRPVSAPQLRRLLAEDRLELKGMSQPSECAPDGAHWVAALVRHRAGRLHDVHFLRLDRNGRWSHKDGNQAVENTDDQGNPIRDLSRASFSGTPQLAGFYWVHSRFLDLIG